MASRLLSFAPTVMAVLPNRRHFAVAGHSQNIEIVDSWTLKVCGFGRFREYHTDIVNSRRWFELFAVTPIGSRVYFPLMSVQKMGKV
jgi:hypothetical protein